MIKILIVEDEPGIRSSLSNAFDWAEMSCELYATAGNGLKALELCLQNPPDIVISDIVMPGIDGLTFIRYIKDKFPKIYFIVLTGHRNFDYAKDALNLGASFFMLKPINYLELKNSLEQLVTKITTGDQLRKEEVQQEKLLANLLNGYLFMNTNADSTTQNILDKLSEYKICAFEIDGNDISQDPLQLDDLLLFCRQLCLNQSIFLLKLNTSHLVMIIYSTYNILEASQLRSFIMKIQQRICSTFKLMISCGISNSLNGFEHLHEGYLQASKALSKKFFTGNQSINFYISNEEIENPNINIDYNITIEAMQKSIELLNNTDDSSLAKSASYLFCELIQPFKQNINAIKSSFIILAVLCIKKVFKEDSRQMALILEKYSNLQKIVQCDSLDILKDIYVNIIIDLSVYRSLKSKGKQNVVDSVISYINENYQNPINLNSAAKFVYLSPTYLSSVIIAETGKGFTDILTETRINRSIDLLKNPDLKISEIAFSVGFKEPQYFSSMFKKIMQISPRAYRELYLNNS